MIFTLPASTWAVALLGWAKVASMWPPTMAVTQSALPS